MPEKFSLAADHENVGQVAFKHWKTVNKVQVWVRCMFVMAENQLAEVIVENGITYWQRMAVTIHRLVCSRKQII
ncbi:MAG: hypothetical protein SOX45_07060 [Lachnospiraceae bacterium]|nr:hypothetical protein [Lachnospiraceae bacterium]